MHEPLQEQEWVTRVPAGPLRPFVDTYVGYRLAGFPPGIHRGLPSRHMTFIVGIGQTIDVAAQSDPVQDPQRYGCVLSGLQASVALIAHDGNQEGVAIELTPLGSRTLLGMPAGELWDLSLEFAHVVGGPGGELWERLQHTVGWEQRFSVCDDVLSSLVGENLVAPELQHCWGTLVASGGRISVSDLAAQTGYSRQHLGRRFRREFGLSPKLAGGVMFGTAGKDDSLRAAIGGQRRGLRRVRRPRRNLCACHERGCASRAGAGR